MNVSRFGLGSIRSKLTMAAVTPLVIILILVALAASSLISAWIVGETQKKVHNDLNAARAVLTREKNRVQDVVRFTAHSSGLAEALQRRDLSKLSAELELIRRREGLDILNLTDNRGTIIVRSGATSDAAPSKQRPVASFVRRALNGQDYAGTALIPAPDLRLENATLIGRAAIDDRSHPAQDTETSGMFLVGAAAVHDKQAGVLGCLYGGVLLNNNLPLVDKIRDLVYGKESYEGIEVGSATIFLGDLRVATTIRLKNGQRALGTRVSAEVAEAVLKRGESWLARAKVVDEWYLTAYEPIRNAEGQAIGALYVGLLEKPFVALKVRAYAILFGLLLLGCGLGGLLARLFARRLSQPVLELAATAERVADGELGLTLPVASHNEIGHLTRAFNRMTASLKERDQELHQLNRELEQKVRDRTLQLEEKSLALIKVQEELLRNEKLAAIGSLAAGVAHEINNPAAIIRGNVEILLMDRDSSSEGSDEIQQILKQTERISHITQNMLAFAREQEIHPESVQINPIIEEVLAQVRHQEPIDQVRIDQGLAADLPPVVGDAERLRQVFTNIIVNALQAMNGEGILQVSSRVDADEVEICCCDSGPGIPEAIRGEIFDPFFTTKNQGTGLGLSVSYGIVKALKGSILVDSRVGSTSFRVRLPIA